MIALLPTLMLAAPAFAQEVQTQTTPPPAPVEQAAPVAPAAPVFAPSTPVVQAVPDYTRAAPPPVVPTAAEAPAEPVMQARRTTVTRTPRAVPAPRVETAPPVTAAPVAAPVVDTSAPTPPAAEPATPNAPVTEVATDTTSTQTNTEGNAAMWPWIVGAGVILLGLIAFFVGRRRRVVDTAAYDEPLYEPTSDAQPRAVPAPIMAAPAIALTEPHVLQPAVVADPVAAPAPVPAEETKIVAADDADVAALTDGPAPVADRPWLEFAMRPVRAGTTSDEALVEIELTVGNAGSVTAEDVRIATFLFASEPADAEDFERLLLEHGADAGTERVDIVAGEGTRIDATLALPKRDLAALFNPVVVADARYRLADGSEGRTYASFAIGMTQEDGGFGGIENDRPSMHDDIEARLYGTPQHA